VLVTSREPLHLESEQRYPVEPLPDEDAEVLFIERARAVAPGFRPTATVVEICRRVNGLPLAIELAAARVRVLGPEGTARRLGERLAFLARKAPDLPPRQRSLRATIDWSYELLDEEARRAFRAFGVFAGSVSPDAVDAVDGTDAASGLEALLDAGLIVHHPDASGEPRFGMLETIREYALGKLDALGALERKGSSTSLAYALYMLGCISADTGDAAEAGRWASRALDEILVLGFHELLGYELVLVAELVLDGASEGAARLLGASAEAFRRAGLTIQSREAARVEQMEATLRGVLGSDELGRLQDEGSQLTTEAAVALAHDLLETRRCHG
jgi:predicted ATPase